MTMDLDEVTVRGMRFHARVGILDHERVLPQPIEIDCTVSLRPGGASLDYRQLHQATAAVIAREPIDLLEQVAGEVAAAALGLDDRAMRVRVAVRKPHVALAGPVDHAEIVVIRHRDG
jgi:7,8-dihydroneopterin aldolase/epimerase/oxygenase